MLAVATRSFRTQPGLLRHGCEALAAAAAGQQVPPPVGSASGAGWAEQLAQYRALSSSSGSVNEHAASGSGRGLADEPQSAAAASASERQQGFSSHHAEASFNGNNHEQPHDYEHPEDDPGSSHRRHAPDERFLEQRRKLLDAALRHVPQLGWAGGAAAAAAAEELGLSPAAAGILGSDAGFVQAFFAECNGRLERELADMGEALEGMDVRERVRTGLRLRLRMLEPYLPTWPQALALLASPAAAPRTLGLYADLADAIWHAAGDRSMDQSWYTKRALVGGVYAASELYMLTDSSPGYADTWAALDRRLGEAFDFEEAAGDATSLAGALGSAAATITAQLGALLRRPPL